MAMGTKLCEVRRDNINCSAYTINGKKRQQNVDTIQTMWGNIGWQQCNIVKVELMQQLVVKHGQYVNMTLPIEKLREGTCYKLPRMAHELLM